VEQGLVVGRSAPVRVTDSAGNGWVGSLNAGALAQAMALRCRVGHTSSRLHREHFGFLGPHGSCESSDNGGATLATSPARLRGGGHREARFSCRLRMAPEVAGSVVRLQRRQSLRQLSGEQGGRPCDGISRWAASSGAVGRGERGGNALVRTASGSGSVMVMLSSCSARDAPSVRRWGRCLALESGGHVRHFGAGGGFGYRDDLRSPRRSSADTSVDALASSRHRRRALGSSGRATRGESRCTGKRKSKSRRRASVRRHGRGSHRGR
jgi:hypothetical protein